MWYFSWILGIGVALSFGIVNAMWLEARQKTQEASVRARSDRRTDALTGGARGRSIARRRPEEKEPRFARGFFSPWPRGHTSCIDANLAPD